MSEVAAHYAQTGFTTRLGFGARPAVLVIDLFRAFTDPASPLALPLAETVERTAELLAVAREHQVPVIFVVVRYENAGAEAPALVRKNPVLARLTADSEFRDVDPRLGSAEGDLLVAKTGASAFFHTPLAQLLNGLAVDTVVVTGAATSGCVRISVVDAIQYGFAPVVVRECVGDRHALAHEVALAEMDAKYADVESLADVSARLKEQGR